MLTSDTLLEFLALAISRARDRNALNRFKIPDKSRFIPRLSGTNTKASAAARERFTEKRKDGAGRLCGHGALAADEDAGGIKSAAAMGSRDAGFQGDGFAAVGAMEEVPENDRERNIKPVAAKKRFGAAVFRTILAGERADQAARAAGALGEPTVADGNSA